MSAQHLIFSIFLIFTSYAGAIHAEQTEKKRLDPITVCSAEDLQANTCALEYLGGTYTWQRWRLPTVTVGLTCLTIDSESETCTDVRLAYTTEGVGVKISPYPVEFKKKIKGWTAERSATTAAFLIGTASFVGALAADYDPLKTVLIMPVAIGIDVIKAPVTIPASIVYIAGNSIKGLFSAKKFRNYFRDMFAYMLDPQNVGETKLQESRSIEFDAVTEDHIERLLYNGYF